MEGHNMQPALRRWEAHKDHIRKTSTEQIGWVAQAHVILKWTLGE